MAIPIFAPARAPSINYSEPQQFNVKRSKMHAGYETFHVRSLRSLRRAVAEWTALDQDEHDYIVSFFQQFDGNVGAFQWKSPDAVPSPSGEEPALSAVSGGTLSSRTIYVRFTWYSSTAGETKPSKTASLAVPANNFLKANVSVFPAGVDSWRVYASETEGSEELQATISDSRSWTQSAALGSGASPPSSNTLKPTLKWFLSGEPLQKARDGPTTWAIRLRLLQQVI